MIIFIVLSSIIHQSGHNLEDKINETDKKLENLCKVKDVIFKNNVILMYWIKIFQKY